MRSEGKAVVYGCSGCSGAGQMANALAVRLDREGRAEMSCIAGVGGGVESLVRKARSAARVVAIDGCPLHCALNSLRLRGVEPALHVDLAALGVLKRPHGDFDPAQAGEIYGRLAQALAGEPALAGSPD